MPRSGGGNDGYVYEEWLAYLLCTTLAPCEEPHFGLGLAHSSEDRQGRRMSCYYSARVLVFDSEMDSTFEVMSWIALPLFSHHDISVKSCFCLGSTNLDTLHCSTQRGDVTVASWIRDIQHI